MSGPTVPPGTFRAPLRRRIFLGLALTGLVLSAFVGVPSAQSLPPVSVSIQQLDWLGSDGQVTGANSTGALAEFTFSSAAAGLAVGPDGAFVNLYTSVDGGTTYQLAVENLFVRFDTEAELTSGRLGALIDLGNADETTVDGMSYQVSLTQDPVDPLVSSLASSIGARRGPASTSTGTAFFLPFPFPSSSPTPFPSPSPSPSPSPTPSPDASPTPIPSPSPAPSPSPGVDDIYFDSDAQSPDDVPGDYVEPEPAPVYPAPPLPSEPVYVVPVQHVGYAFGGYGGGGLLVPGRPPRPQPFRPVVRPRPPVPPPPPPPPGRPRPLGGVLGQVPVVNESPMSCAPSAVARSIAYMLNLRGRPANAQAIMGALYQLMGTSPVTGTSMQGILQGKAAFSGANGLGINTAWPANAGQAATTLNNGGDVELNILWPNTGACPGGGHVAMVTSITLLPNGNFQVTYVDDVNQHDGIGANNNHTLIVRPNGAIVSGFPCPGGVIAGLIAENMR